MSPVCAATIFEGDNGGGTWSGVSGTAIRIAVPGSFSDDIKQSTIALFEYFNRHFELYGRRLEPVFTASLSSTDPAANRALAVDIASQGVFAVFPGALERGTSALPSLYQELARKGVLSLPSNMGQALSDQLIFDELHPYVWSAYPSMEQIWRNFADFACTSLVGKPARHAGSPALQATTRKFGVIAAGRYAVPRTTVLRDGLASCGAELVTAEYDSSRDTSTAITNAVQRFKDAGVTTVTCACFTAYPPSIAEAAVSMGFHPEWVLTSHYVGSDEFTVQYFPTSERPHTFMVGEREKVLPLQARPWFQAIQELRPSLLAGVNEAGALFETLALAARMYQPLLMLASGAQSAGPNLTPDTFAAGLLSTQFANAGAGQAPYWQPSVGFGPGDHSLIDDYALAWWDETAEATEATSLNIRVQGSFCYVGLGARFRPGAWPADADSRLFDKSGGCR